ncbi:hypothetical protein PW035_35795 [Nonomuraea angiospora]|nr:hypothetical protein [Nonomuraea angiospora]MDX3106228.1 hypothetical protein [Nonomuraea angiospora]
MVIPIHPRPARRPLKAGSTPDIQASASGAKPPAAISSSRNRLTRTRSSRNPSGSPATAPSARA